MIIAAFKKPLSVSAPADPINVTIIRLRNFVGVENRPSSDFSYLHPFNRLSFRGAASSR